MTWSLMWRNVSATTLYATFQLLVIYRLISPTKHIHKLVWTILQEFTKAIILVWSSNCENWNCTIVYSALQISINTLKHVFRQMLYRASSNVIVSPFVENPSCLIGEESISDRCLPVWKPGSLGSGSAVSLLNIKTTVDMVGLYSGHSCTHNRPTWIDRNTSFGLHDSFSELSISSNCLSSLYSLHAWEFRSLVNVSLGGK